MFLFQTAAKRNVITLSNNRFVSARRRGGNRLLGLSAVDHRLRGLGVARVAFSASFLFFDEIFERKTTRAKGLVGSRNSGPRKRIRNQRGWLEPNKHTVRPVLSFNLCLPRCSRIQTLDFQRLACGLRHRRRRTANNLPFPSCRKSPGFSPVGSSLTIA